MESAIKTVVSVYLKSAKGKENLSSKEFQSLVKNQLGGLLINADSKDAVKNMQEGLDQDHDGKVSFQEYMKLIGYMANNLSNQHVSDKESKPAESNDGAATQSEAPAAAEAEPAPATAAATVEEPAADRARLDSAEPAAPTAGNGEAEKAPEEPAAENTAEEKTEEDEAS
ncbi:S100 calcium binding protein U [Sardina pilchardus]|uniref:S100 calcium binding protein U n=1 Tax=Sardina pilchardus TaxID=27697 RepID=UPI002E0DE33B